MKTPGKILSKSDADTGSSRASGAGDVHVWERWHTVSHYVLYALLGLSMASAFFDGPPSWGYRGAVIGLTLLFSGWHWITVHTHPEWSQCRPIKVLVYFAVAVPLFVALTYLHPAYMSLTFFLYWNNYSLWPMRWAIPGMLLLTVLMVWRGSGLDGEFHWPSPVGLLAFGITAVISIVISLFIDAIINQSQERRRLIEELEATREELAAEERRAGVLEERGRLAREIHDTLAQGFISITTHLEAAERTLQPTGAGRRHLHQARDTARESLSEARRLVRALRPELLETSSLPEALERLAGRWQEETGVTTRVDIAGERAELSQELQVTLFRTAQEALANARRHADAGRVDLTLSYLDDLVVLDVHDDGAGFDPGAAANGGFGLAGLRERAESLGGRLVVESAPGEGTTMVAELPATERAASPGGRA